MGSQAKETPPQPHVIVIGAGIVGASLAWHLIRDGARVTIVAADEEGAGGTATPCSFAWLNASWHNPRFYYDFRLRSMAAWERLAGQVPPLRPLVRWEGGLGWDLPPDQREAYLREHAAWGYAIRRVERADIQALEPALLASHDDNDFLPPEWGVHAPREGAVEAAQAARVLVADAQARGAVLVPATTVTELLVLGPNPSSGDNHNTIKGVKTAAGATLAADHVVLAAGLGAVPLAASVDVTLPLADPPAAGLLIHTTPAPAGLLRSSVVCAPTLHMRQSPDGRLHAGTDFAGGDPGPDPDAAARALLARVKAAFRPGHPGVDALALDYVTVGYRPKPRDGLPILGATGVAGLSVAVMHSGVTNAAIVGELLSERILTGREDPALKDFSLSRFTKTSSSS